MTSIVEVATHLPPQRVPIGPRLVELGLEANVELYERFYGFARVRDEPDRGLADQLCAAAEKLTTLRGRERDLIENPLGFQVTAYTVDSELIDTPRVESPASSSIVSNGSAISTGEQPLESLDPMRASEWHSPQEGTHSAAPEVRR